MLHSLRKPGFQTKRRTLNNIEVNKKKKKNYYKETKIFFIKSKEKKIAAC